jgi:hypothetical protein
MRYIALEEAFSIPGLAEPMPQLSSLRTPYSEQWLRKLPDFTEFRLPEMDAAGIDIQVLSLTVPGLQVDIDEPTAKDNARRANDYLAQVVSEHPTRCRCTCTPGRLRSTAGMSSTGTRSSTARCGAGAPRWPATPCGLCSGVCSTAIPRPR